MESPECAAEIFSSRISRSVSEEYSSRQSLSTDANLWRLSFGKADPLIFALSKQAFDKAEGC